MLSVCADAHSSEPAPYVTTQLLLGTMHSASLLLEGADPPSDLHSKGKNATLQAGTGRKGSMAVQRGNA